MTQLVIFAVGAKGYPAATPLKPRANQQEIEVNRFTAAIENGEDHGKRVSVSG